MLLEEWRYIKLRKPRFEISVEEASMDGKLFRINIKSDTDARVVRLKSLLM